MSTIKIDLNQEPAIASRVVAKKAGAVKVSELTNPAKAVFQALYAVSGQEFKPETVEVGQVTNEGKFYGAGIMRGESAPVIMVGHTALPIPKFPKEDEAIPIPGLSASLYFSVGSETTKDYTKFFLTFELSRDGTDKVVTLDLPIILVKPEEGQVAEVLTPREVKKRLQAKGKAEWLREPGGAKPLLALAKGTYSVVSVTTPVQAKGAYGLRWTATAVVKDSQGQVHTVFVPERVCHVLRTMTLNPEAQLVVNDPEKGKDDKPRFNGEWLDLAGEPLPNSLDDWADF